jgi:carbonic anhydrase-like protein
MERGTVINCLDGRIQYPVLDFLRNNYNIKFVDAVTEAGPIKILTERTDKCRLFSLKEQVIASLELNGSKFIAVVGHHDCRGNPEERDVQEKQIDNALEYLRKAYGDEIIYVGLYVNERWEVEEYKRIG